MQICNSIDDAQRIADLLNFRCDDSPYHYPDAQRDDNDDETGRYLIAQSEDGEFLDYY